MVLWVVGHVHMHGREHHRGGDSQGGQQAKVNCLFCVLYVPAS